MAIALGRRSQADRLSRAFGRALAGTAASRSSGPAALLGLEHEFRVLDHGRAVDFGRLIHDLPIPGRRLDPTDPNAYRGSWGGAITADGREAEIAIAPVESGPGLGDEVLARATQGRSLLEAALPAGLRLEGYSTHLSVAVPRGLEERAARLYVGTFAPALMLLLDGPGSPGLLVRPRPGRLELGGEFVDGERLRAVAAFALGSVRAVALAARRQPFAGRGLPTRIAVAAVPALDRYGWFVARDAVGGDLYATGRATPLRRRRGGPILAGAHLEACWAVVRRAIADLVSAADLATADRYVAGLAPLGLEGTQAEAIAFHCPRASTAVPDPTAVAADPFGQVMTERSRPGFEVTPAIVAWDFVVLRLDGDRSTAYACLPRSVLGEGLRALDEGRLDDLLRGYLAASDAGGGRRLEARHQTSAAGLYGAVGKAANLLAPERSPLGGGGDRPGKRRRDDRPRDRRPQRPDQGAQAAAGSAGVGGAAVAGLGGAAAAGLGATAGASGSAAAAAGGAGLFGLPIAAVAGIGGLVVVALIAGAVVLGGASPATPTPIPPTAIATVIPTSTVSSTPAATGPSTSPSFAPEPSPDPSCAREGSLRSTKGDQATSIRFINHIDVTVRTFWLDYAGKRVLYGTMPPGSSYEQPTWITHPWIMADPQGTCLLLVVTDKNLSTVQLGP